MSRSPSNKSGSGSIHDAYFKQLIAVPAKADRLLRDHLPRGLVRLFAPRPPELVRDTFVGQDLEERSADLLFRVWLIDGSDVLVHVLFEHKSAPSRLARLQILGYKLRIWSDWARRRRPPNARLPPVIAVVVHHGARPWPYAEEFAELFAPLPATLEPYMPRFEHVLIDLTSIPDEHLSSDPVLAAELLVLKRIQQPDIARTVNRLLLKIVILDDLALATVLTYIAAKLGSERLEAAIEEVAASQEGARMATFTEYLMEKGRAKGKAEGRSEGKAEVLARQMKRRFGPLPAKVRERIAQASPEELDLWLDRVVDAPDLAGVLAPR